MQQRWISVTTSPRKKTIQEIKLLIEEQEGIPSKKQHLYYGTHYLYNHCQLDKLQIRFERHLFLEMILGLPGGVEPERKRTYLVVGFSQNGKTSLINALLQSGQKEGNTGKPGEGLSCTSEISKYTCQNSNILENQTFSLIDTIGLGDTLLKSKSVIKSAILDTLASWDVTVIDGIIIPDSAVNSTTTVSQVHLFLAGIFGHGVAKSMLVVMTKSNAMVVKSELNARWKALNELQGQLGFRGPVKITTAYKNLERIQISEYDEQWVDLNEDLKKLTPINLKEKLKRQQELIERKAKEIEEKETVIEKVEYEESYVEMETKTVEKIVPGNSFHVGITPLLSFDFQSTKTIDEEQNVPTTKTSKKQKDVLNKPKWEDCLEKARAEYYHESKKEIENLLQ